MADSSTDCTTAFHRAISFCHGAGGGHVVVPAGDYATGPIHLLGNVDLHLERDSTLLFHTDPAAYPQPVFSRWQGIELMNYSPLIYAYGQHDIAITGEGVLDAQADATHWLDWKPIGDVEFPQLEAMANAGIPVPQRVAAPTFHFRPPFVPPYRCTNVLIQRSTFANGHGGVTIGSEMTGGVRAVFARDLQMNSPDLQSGHRIKTNSVCGGFVRDVHLGRITAGTIGGPMLLIDFNYGEGDTGTFPPIVTDINLSDWTVAACAPAWQMAGYTTDPVGIVALTGVTVAGMSGTNTALNVTDLRLTDVTIAGQPAG